MSLFSGESLPIRIELATAKPAVITSHGRSIKSTLVLLLILWLTAGCRGNPPPVVPEQPPSAGIPASRPLPEGDRASLPQPPSAEDGLVLWVPPFFSIDTTERADAVLAAALAELAPTATDAPVRLIAKAERGQAGILPYLLTANQVASKLLPDIALLNSFDLVQAASAGLLLPLAAQESAPFIGIPPQILQTAQMQGALYGLPYVANLEHLVYQKERISTPPTTRDRFLAQEKRILFAGGSVDDYSINFLSTLYLLEGGKVDEQGAIADPQILRAVLEFLEQSRQRGLIAESAVTLSSPQAVWTFFINGNTEMAVVPAALYYEQQGESEAIGFAQLPTLDGEIRSVVTSWSFVIVTQEPQRRQKATMHTHQ